MTCRISSMNSLQLTHLRKKLQRLQNQLKERSLLVEVV